MNEHKKFGKLLKRLLIVCLCLVMALGSAVTIIATSFDGDLNNDGQVTALDAQLLAEYEADLRDLDLTDKIGLTVKSIIDWILGRTESEPSLDEGVEVAFEVEAENGIVTEDKTVTADGVTATVAAGTKVTGKTLKLSVKKTDSAEGEVALGENQEQLALDIHVDGVAADNTTPVVITVEQALDNGYNQGNLELYHVEDSVANEMEQVATAALNEHNSFYYDPATGDVTVAMATFSVVRAIAKTTKEWEGKFDYTWYDADAKELFIANADQLAAFGAIVGGMKKVTGINEDGTYTYSAEVIQDSFSGQTVKLTADINLADDEENNVANKIFYPIGYWNNEGTYERLPVDERVEAVSSGFYTFNGTFDGQGHTIANFYHNTWEMKGDHNWYDATLQYYRDGMGLFGKVYGGTVKNLTVDNFSSDGEIATTGVIAAYADGATFENIAITNCNPRVYNIGNGGIVGCVGWYAKEANLKTTFKNITVDNSNKISALWGSYDVACGGIVGQYYPTSGQSSAEYPVNGGIDLVNCHVAAQMDVYNDVCGNYQYYAYRYAGMLIGSIRENVTGDDGHVYPKMDGITASGCTVHYDSWNDYYYCEFEKNGHPSYAGENDYKFSRVPESELNFNADGTVTCKHEHSDVEDNRAIYLPFSQLFTGYGWGVTSKGIEDFEGVEVKHVDQKDSVEKFEGTGEKTVTANKAIKLNTLFAEKDGNTIAIKDANIQVAVSALTDDDADVTVSLNKTGFDEWEDYELTFTGNGTVKVTIQDYYFCTPTTITLTVEDRADEVKFENKFTGNFLYRVGNQNEVALGSLFTAKDGATIGTVDVTVENVEGNASGTYTSNTTWTSGTIKFSGTGVVKVTITDNDYCTPTELMLEVITAKNVTALSDWTNDTTVVLLNDIELTTTKYITKNNTLYGNGFTIDATGAPYSGVQYDYQSYVIYLENSTMDNVVIEGLVYPEIGGTKTDDYYRALVMTNGDCKISNCYLSHTASPIRNGGNLELVNSKLVGGAYANMDIRNGHTILDNVTTFNQFNGGYNSVGLGVVVFHEGGTEELKITIRNKLTQYNLISQAQTSSLSGSAKTFVDAIFDNFKEYQYEADSTKWVNSGIISMNNYFTEEDLVDERTDKEGYFAKSETISVLMKTRDCVAYSTKPTSSEASGDAQVIPGNQGAIAPETKFDFKNKNYVAKTDGSNDYCYEDSGTVYISMDEGDTFAWDTSILTVTKNGADIPYTVTVDNVDYTGKSITFDANGEHTVTYSYTDPYNYTTVKQYSVDYKETIKINVVVVEAAAKNAEFSFGANGTAYSSKTVTIGDKTYVMPDVTATVSGKIGSTTVNGTTVYYPITEMYTSDGKTEHSSTWYACFPIFKNALQIIDYADAGTGDPVTYNQEKVTTVAQIPATLKATNPKTAFLYSMNATNYPPPTDPTAVSGAVCYTCNRNGLTKNARDEMTIIAEYTYTDNAGKVYYYYVGYHCAKQTAANDTCLAEGTMITLADGSKKAVEDLRKDDMVMSFDHVTGALTSRKVIIVVKTAQDDYFKNTFVFDDGTELTTINEHGIFDLDLNKYVNIDHQNYREYIGHRFVSVNTNGKIGIKKLVDVVTVIESGYKYDIVTDETLNYVAEDTLSVTHVLVDVINTFDFGENLKYDATKMQSDIAEYGLYTYDEWAPYCDITVFEQYNIPVMKVGISKGVYTQEYIIGLINTYVLDDSVQIID